MQINLFAVSVFVLGCFVSCDGNLNADKVSDLEEATKVWQQAKPSSYTVDVERICFCPPPQNYTLVVANGNIEQVIDAETGDVIEEYGGYTTIDELFEWLQEIASGNPQKLELEFHKELGYPTFIDYNQSDLIADEEMLMRLQNLRTE